MEVARSRRRWILVTALAIAAVAALAVGGYITWLITPPPLPQSVEQAMDFIGSKRYEQMPDYRKREYLEQTRRLVREMPQEKRVEVMQRVRSDPVLRGTMGRVWRAEMAGRATDFARADPSERTRLLDEAIDRMGQWRGGRRRRDQGRAGEAGRPQRRTDSNAPGGGDAGGRPDRRGRMRDRIQGMFEEGNPQTAALIGEFFRAMRKRREERGLPVRR